MVSPRREKKERMITMKKVYDVRLNDYCGQIVWTVPMVNEYGDIYGHEYYETEPNDPFAEQVIIGFDSHDDNCYCDRCRSISDVYDQIYISDAIPCTKKFTW